MRVHAIRLLFATAAVLLSLPLQAAISLTPVVTTGIPSAVFLGNAHDGSNRLFIVQQGGIISVLQPGSNTPTVFLDIHTRISSGSERGLLGLAFHPQYFTNGRFFVFYTRAGDGALVVAEYRVSSNPNVANMSETVLLTIPHPSFGNHNGGMLAFGPDTYLHIGTGDGGSFNDPGNNAQNIESLLGKILRIDVNTPDPIGGTLYSSPSDNPFVGVAGRDEIFAFGMRNPWRFSFDRVTGQQWVGDVGQDQREEVDAPLAKGGNYGWRVYEGSGCTGVDPGLCNPANYLPPLFEYSHTGNRCSITGGYVYRGAGGALPVGTYVYGDFCTGEIFIWNGSNQSLLLDTAMNISSFGEDELGEIYVVDLNGTVSKIVASEASTTTTLVSSANPAVAGTSVTFTATVSGSSPTGTVNFTDGGSTLSGCGAVPLAGGGNSRAAACTTSSLAVGTHAIAAAYSGDGNNAASSSTPLSQVIHTAAATLVNPSFETPVMGSGFQYDPSGSGIGWSFSFSSGIQGNGSAWGAAAAPDGTQSAFIQGGGSISQIFNLNAGNYTLSFMVARRSYSVPAGDIQPIRVSVDGTLVGGLVSPSSTSFSTVTLAFSIAVTGAHTLTFAGTDGSGDKSTFLDAVTITPSAAGAPVFMTPSSTTFAEGLPGSFTIQAAGSPTPALSVSGTLPAGIGLTDNGNGTATLSGVPAAGTAGIYPLTFTATNAAGSTNQSFALTVVAASLSNASFEAPPLGNGFQYGPSGAGVGWTFYASAGIQGNGSAWEAAPAPDGTQTAFIQGSGSLTQTIHLNAGDYTLSFQTARRFYSVPAGGEQPIRVSIDGTQIGLISPPSTSFGSVSIPFVIATTGTYTLEFAGTDGSGDKSTFIDAVAILP
jgi:hypothetical protein